MLPELAFCRISIFSKNLELLNLSIPFLWYPLVFLDILFFHGAYGLGASSINTKTIFDFIRNILFLNSVHVLFSYLIMFRSTEVKAWIVKQKGGAIVFWTKLGIVHILFFLFFILLKGGVFSNSLSINSSFIDIIVAIVTIAPVVHHPLAQTWGLSFLYDLKNYNCQNDKKTKLIRAGKRERGILVIFTIIYMVAGLIFFSGHFRLDNFSWSIYLISLLFLVSSLVIINYFTYPKPWNLNKLIFLMRLFAYPLTFISASARIVTGSCHGIEYFCVYKKIKKNSNGRCQWFSIAYLLLFLLGFFSILSLYGQTPFVKKIIPDFLSNQQYLTPLALSIIYTHYYVDALLYRFRDSSNRELILPLLVKN